MTTLHELYERCGQSPWIDDLKRSYVRQDGLQRLVDSGIRGVTSNPTIMAKAIEAGSDYDEQFAALVAGHKSVEDAYWDLVIDDVLGALEILRPTFEASNGGDGFVSLEVDPSLAYDTAGTAALAESLHDRIAKPNLLVKIPATEAGLGAIEEMIAKGKSINVTLIFSLERYSKVIDAYQSGLERFVSGGGDPSTVASVASFFISRVDTEVDRRLEAIAAPEPTSALAKRALSLRGQAALAQGRLAYQLFTDRFGDARFSTLEGSGARRQRPLFASTSTKNPSYPDLLYVEGLIGPDTVDTMPEETVSAFLDHGKVARTVDEDPGAAQAVVDALGEVGVEMDEVTAKLEEEGVASFSKSFVELIDSLKDKAEALTGKGSSSGGAR